MVNIYNMNNIYEETKFLMKKYNVVIEENAGICESMVRP